MSEISFVWPKEKYVRHLDPIEDWVEQSAFFLSRMKGGSEEEYVAKLKESAKAGKLGLKNPQVVYFRKKENGDRELARTTLNGYINTIKKNKYIVAPTFTAYCSVEENESPLGLELEQNGKDRSVVKNQAIEFRRLGDMVNFGIYNNEQNNIKINSNSLSGLFSSIWSVFYNPTGHNTLTSITRMETSISNGFNEKFLSGNRHYHNYDEILRNINFLAFMARDRDIKSVMEKYRLVYPTVEQTVDAVMKSAVKYIPDPSIRAKLTNYVSKLTDEERASIVYTNDFYHIRKYNEGFVRRFFERMLAKASTEEIENPKEILKGTEELLLNYIHVMFLDLTVMYNRDYDDYPKEGLYQMANTAKKCRETMFAYLDFFLCFFSTRDMPNEVPIVRELQRESVVLSDTDSTMFSTDEWVIWYYGKHTMRKESFAITYLLSYIGHSAIVHLLAHFSSIIGVAPKELHRIGMKPEYFFPVFLQTAVAKHYAAIQLIQEGRVFKEPVFEEKGVHLKNSSVDKEIIAGSIGSIRRFLVDVMEEKDVSLKDIVREIVEFEVSIRDEIMASNTKYFKSVVIKTADSYSLGEYQSPYWNYLNWQEVWAEKYGPTEPPIYLAYQVPLAIPNKTIQRDWLAAMEDRELAGRIESFYAKSGKNNIVANLYIPQDVVDERGVPKEILDIVDIDKIILSLTKPRRMLLEALGWYIKPDTPVFKHINYLENRK